MMGIELFLKKKKTKPKYGCEQHKNLPKDEKQRLVEYKKYHKIWKNRTVIYQITRYMKLFLEISVLGKYKNI